MIIRAWRSCSYLSYSESRLREFNEAEEFTVFLQQPLDSGFVEVHLDMNQYEIIKVEYENMRYLATIRRGSTLKSDQDRRLDLRL
jgi:hypothetical protein